MTELQPLFDYFYREPGDLVHNFGTVVDFAPWPKGFSKRRIGDWRITHPDLKVFSAYGVRASYYPDGSWALGHGSHLAVEGRDKVRYYWFGAGCVDWDTLLIPARIVADWDEGEPKRQLHFPDLKWFDPYYGFNANGIKVKENYSLKELKQEIKHRVAYSSPVL